METAVVIPAHNEGKHIASVIQGIKPYVQEIIVVDDGSEDDTVQQAGANGAQVLLHKVNLGKGAALKTGCDYALLRGARQMIVMDADGQHDPKEIPLFLEGLQHHDIIFAARKMPTKMPWVLRLGNGVINRTLRVLYHLRVEDSQCGYRAFTSSAYQQVRWDALDYFVETEMLIKAGKKKLTHTQVAIDTIYADKYKGTTILDGVLIVAKMIGGRLW